MTISMEEFGQLKPVKSSMKNITLISGKEESFWWGVYTRITEIGTFRGKGTIEMKDDSASKRFYKNNKEEMIQKNTEWRKSHPEEWRSFGRNYYETHREEIKERVAIWKEENPDAWNKIFKKHNAKRKRGLGFKPINEPFEGAEAHHLDKEYVIYIPKELHRSISHNVFTERGMEEINSKALNWLESRGGVDEN